jgi:hypothetical protein
VSFSFREPNFDTKMSEIFCIFKCRFIYFCSGVVYLIELMLQAGKSGSVPSSDMKVSLPQLSEKFSTSPSLLYEGKRGLFPGSKAAEA